MPTRTVLASVVVVLWAWMGLMCSPASGQQAGVRPESLPQGVILVVEDATKQTSTASPMYLASNINGWNPADPAMRLQGRSDMRWQIVLPGPLPTDRLEFKFTRGSWELEELDAGLKKISNRTLPAVDVSRLRAGEAPIFEFRVEAWGDQTPEFKTRRAKSPFRELSVTGTVRRLQVVGGGAQPGGGGMMRDALVWLPPGYDDPANAERSYPVLYLQDGQNVFEQLPGVPGEWGADETATRLIAEGAIRPLIIVAIPHAGPNRVREYLPVPAGQFTEAGGDAYADWLVGQVMPRVERAFRVARGPEHTAIGGASMGALVSLHTVRRHPGVFGGVILESLPLMLGGPGVWERYLAEERAWPGKVFLGMGDRETGAEAEKAERNAAYVRRVTALAERLRGDTSLGAREVVLEIGAGEVHNEQAWARRLPIALRLMFPAGR